MHACDTGAWHAKRPNGGATKGTLTAADAPSAACVASPHRSCLRPQDANEALLRGFDLKELLRSARPVPHDQIATFDDLRDEVFREVLSPELLSGTP